MRIMCFHISIFLSLNSLIQNRYDSHFYIKKYDQKLPVSHGNPLSEKAAPARFELAPRDPESLMLAATPRGQTNLQFRRNMNSFYKITSQLSFLNFLCSKRLSVSGMPFLCLLFRKPLLWQNLFPVVHPYILHNLCYLYNRQFRS